MCDSIWSHNHHLERSLRMRRVTWPITGGRNDPHFWNRWPKFSYSLCHFRRATTKIKLCYMRKIALLWRLQSSLRMRSITWPVHRGSPKPHVTIFWPRLIYSLYNYCGATMTIKGSLYWSISMLKRFSAAKKPKSSQNRFQKWRFFENLRVYILTVIGKSRIWGAKTPEGSSIKFGMPSDVHHVVTHANFCQDWLNSFSVARGWILAFSIDLLRRL